MILLTQDYHCQKKLGVIKTGYRIPDTNIWDEHLNPEWNGDQDFSDARKIEQTLLWSFVRTPPGSKLISRNFIRKKMAKMKSKNLKNEKWKIFWKILSDFKKEICQSCLFPLTQIWGQFGWETFRLVIKFPPSWGYSKSALFGHKKIWPPNYEPPPRMDPPFAAHVLKDRSHAKTD